MKAKRSLGALLCAGVLVAAGTLGAQNPATGPAVDPRADALLRKMSEFLAAANACSFRVHAVTEQVRENGQKVEFARNSVVTLRRPDRLNVTMTGDLEEMRFIYDGRQMTIENVKDKVYGQLPMPPTIDAAIDTLATRHGLVIPLADLVESDPYKTLSPLIRSGEYLGTGYVFDTRCHHLAFRQEKVDWQIWIDQGATPVPRKVVITYKESPALLQYVAYLDSWEFATAPPDSTFTFAPAADEKKVEALVPATQPAPAPR